MDRSENGCTFPSFSSNVLDAIYRSIDAGEDRIEAEARGEMVSHGGTGNVRREGSSARGIKSHEWSEEKEMVIMSEKFAPRRSPRTILQRSRTVHQGLTLLHSCSSSSQSSEAAEHTFARPKPVRTQVAKRRDCCISQHQRKAKRDGLVKSKSMTSLSSSSVADAKGPKQSASPGSRLAGFLNSLLTAAAWSARKTKCSHTERRGTSIRPESSTTSACSPASSYSRSCLVKTPSSKASSLKSVRFCPVDVDHKQISEKGRPLGLGDRANLGDWKKSSASPQRLIFGEDLERHIMEKNRRVEEVARDLLKGYGYRKKVEFVGRGTKDVQENAADGEDVDGGEDTYDDGLSCSSSDLFELDHLTGIGIDRHREELPVYGTTRIINNRPVANSLML